MPPPSKTSHLPPSHPAARQRPKSPDRVLKEAEAQWLFSDAELANTPSIQDGMPAAEERETRAKGVNFIVQVGIILKLPQLTLSTAAIFFNRFLMRASFKKPRDGIPKMHHFQIAGTALFLATKVEESTRKMKDLILACCRIAQKNPNLIVDDQSKDWWKWRDTILYNEDILLEVLCFDLTIESPHRILFKDMKVFGVENNRRLRNAAWGFVTDSNNTVLCLMCSSGTIAAASLYAACRYCDVQLPDGPEGKPWWVMLEVPLKEIVKAAEYMAASFEHAAVKTNGATTSDSGDRSIYVSLRTPVEDGESSCDSTRLRLSEHAAVSPYPLGSERRQSDASSQGIKREREREDPSNGQIPSNGVDRDENENKRPRLEEKSNDVENSVEPIVPSEADIPNANAIKHEGEAERVANGDAKEEVTIEKAEEGSEEGEVEE